MRWYDAYSRLVAPQLHRISVEDAYHRQAVILLDGWRTAFIITIMVLELKVPHGTTLNTWVPQVPVFFSYLLSFVYVGIYWNKLQYANNPSILNRDSGSPVAPHACRLYHEPTASGFLGE